jgi:predicted permease
VLQLPRSLASTPTPVRQQLSAHHAALLAAAADTCLRQVLSALATCLYCLVLHPAAIALAALVIWPVEPYAAAVMIASAALPTAGNIFMVAQHYGVAPQRVSATILVSTAFSILTVSLVIAWVAVAPPGP